MSKCIICGKECKGECCGGACRAKKSRRTRTAETAHATERTLVMPKDIKEVGNGSKFSLGSSDAPTLGDVVGVIIDEVDLPRTASYQDYIDHPEDYAKRTHPDWLNWDAWLSADQLDLASKAVGHPVHNRVTLPGDWDYNGVAEQVDGVWKQVQQSA